MDQRLLVHHIDHAREVLLGAYRNANRICGRSEAFTHLAHHISEIRTGTVHLVDERDPRDVVLSGLPPNRLRLRLHAGHAAEHGDGTVQHAHGTLYLCGEVHVARGINDVHAVPHVGPKLGGAVIGLLPETGGGGGGDGNAALTFLLHPVGHGVAIVHFADLVTQARVKQDALSGSRFAGVDMRGNADVPSALQRVLAVWRVQRAGVFFCCCFHLLYSTKKRPGKNLARSEFICKLSYQRKWANALFACAIRCTSSRRRMELPSPS